MVCRHSSAQPGCVIAISVPSTTRTRSCRYLVEASIPLLLHEKGNQTGFVAEPGRTRRATKPLLCEDVTQCRRHQSVSTDLSRCAQRGHTTNVFCSRLPIPITNGDRPPTCSSCGRCFCPAAMCIRVQQVRLILIVLFCLNSRVAPCLALRADDINSVRLCVNAEVAMRRSSESSERCAQHLPECQDPL